MAEVPWLRIIDTVIGVADVALTASGSRGGKEPAPERRDLETRGAAGAEAGLAGVAVAALKEAFDRDARRMHFEREMADAAQRRAERALQLELQRQAGDREIGRMRLLAAVAAVVWIATLLLVTRLTGTTGARIALGIGWLCLVGSIAAAFAAQSGVSAMLQKVAADEDTGRAISSGPAGATALALLLAGLGLTALAALLI